MSLRPAFAGALAMDAHPAVAPDAVASHHYSAMT